MAWTYSTRKPKCRNQTWLIAVGCAFTALCVQNVLAEDYFNPALLDVDNPNQEKTDLSIYESGPGQAPGKYQVDVFVNNNKITNKEITFSLQKDRHGKSTLQPCLSVDELTSLGIKSDHFKDAGDNTCVDLSALPAASATFQVSQQQLLLSIPQTAITQVPRGYVAPEELDEGINALLMNYSFTAGQSHGKEQGSGTQRNEYLNLHPGLNLGAWRLRNYTTWNKTSSQDSTQSDISSVYTYAQRDLIRLGSELTLGQSTSTADVFDSIPYTGFQLASDDDMLPDSMKGFAPAIRGIAHSNAQVIVRQNGYVIYQNYVAPGAFEINDLYPTGGSGDLNVTVKETDGSEQHFVVPYASVPVLQREGRFKYSLTGGQYRSYDGDVEKTSFAQGSAIYGLPYGFTAYGGLQTSQYYHSLAAGFGKNIGDLGAFSVDVTSAKSQLQDQAPTKGRSWRVRYSKNIAATGTNFAIAGYRYNTSGFYTLQDTLDSHTRQDDWTPPDNRRSREEATIDQNLGGERGSVALSLIQENNWHSSQGMTSISLGYNNSWDGISYGLNVSMDKNTHTDSGEDSDDSGDQRTVAFNISVPLDRWLPHTWVNYNLNTTKHDTINSVGINGTALAENNLSWGVQQGQSSSNGYSTSLNTDYKGTYGEATAGYSQDTQQQQINLGLQGSVIAHANGITLGQPTGDTVVLITAPGANGTRINNQTGVSTDFRGYAIVPYASPYRHNTVSLNTETLPDSADVDQAAKTVTPTRGAIVRASFHTRIGDRVLMTLQRGDGKPVPFGATASPAGDDGAFIVGDEGQVYLTGMQGSGKITVSWGKGANNHCTAHYHLPSRHDSQIINVSAQCG